MPAITTWFRTLRSRYTLNKLELNACLSSLNSKFKILLSETKG